MILRYASITGVPEFVNEAIQLAYGKNGDIVPANCIAATQSISGTGGCRYIEKLQTFRLL